MNISIIPISEALFEGLRAALDVVAREKKYLAFTQAPPVEQTTAFYRNIIKNDLCQFTVLVDGQVAGWCDVLPTHGEARAHVGILGIGLLPGARHRGIGRALMNETIAKAKSKGFSRIELTVRTDNQNAKALYERVGFKTEGLNQRAFLIDGQYYDSYSMALLL